MKQTEARTACSELDELAERYQSTMLSAMAAHARGAVALAEGDAHAALVALREARQAWLELEAPYEIARTRALGAQACSALGDDEAATLELAAARDLFRTLGATPDLARLENGGTAAPHGLSPRELEVLRLVATGKSNREIAADTRDQRAHRRSALAEHLREARRSRHGRRRQPSRSSTTSSERRGQK